MEMLKRIFDGEIKDIDKGERTLTAYISTGARDRMDEVLDPAGVDLKQFNKNPVVLFAHDYSSPPIGKALWTKKDKDGILSKVQFANTAFANEIFELYQGGFMKAFSVGFIPKDYTDGDGEKSPRRTYNKWELLEYSAVPVPANPEALMLAVSKGIISESTQKMFGVKKEEEPPVPDPIIEATAPEPVITDLASPELLAEIKILSDKNIVLENEILNLKYKLLEKEKKPATLSEMTDEDITDKIRDIITGVIRKTTGKVT